MFWLACSFHFSYTSFIYVVLLFFFLILNVWAFHKVAGCLTNRENQGSGWLSYFLSVMILFSVWLPLVFRLLPYFGDALVIGYSFLFTPISLLHGSLCKHLRSGPFLRLPPLNLRAFTPFL